MMQESLRAAHGPLPRTRTLTAVAVASLCLAALATAAHAWTRHRARVPASPAQMDAALDARGVAWIWPASNGPTAARAPHYRQAAVLVETLRIGANDVERLPRTQPLVLPGGVAVMPVVHVEAADDAPDALSDEQASAIVAAFRRHVADASAGAGAVQLDFEAPRRERASYQALVARIKAALPPELRLSVTALAHWCTESDWLDHLLADEVVPMLYRLGPRAAHWQSLWLDDGSALAARCRGPAIGFSTREPPPASLLARTPRPYWFDESAWSNASYRNPPIAP